MLVSVGCSEPQAIREVGADLIESVCQHNARRKDNKNSMDFKVTAKRYGDSVKFTVEAEDTKQALQEAKMEANDIFGYKTGDAGAPTVSVEPIPGSEDEDK